MNNDHLVDGYHGGAVANAPTSERVTFMKRTYAHLGGAVTAFVVLEALALRAGYGKVFLDKVASAGSIGWIGIMLLFMGGGWVAQSMARSRNRNTQYLGLAGYVALWVVMFLPILTVGEARFPGVALQAGVITLTVFGGLTAAVLMSKKDFSFLGYGLHVLGWGACGLVLASVVSGGAIGLGLWFSFAMVALACGYILYDTSNILHHYGTDEYVGAALELFASVAMLFFYILRIMYATQSRD